MTTYTTVQFSIPVGHEDHIKKLVLDAIEGILSYEILKPTLAKQTELANEIENAKTIQPVIKPTK